MKKESVRIKAFRARVLRKLQRQGWNVKNQPRGSIVDIITTRADGAKRAFIVKPHGHITRAEMAALHNYEETKGIGVVYIHESSGQEILFTRLYKHLGKVR